MKDSTHIGWVSWSEFFRRLGWHSVTMAVVCVICVADLIFVEFREPCTIQGSIVSAIISILFATVIPPFWEPMSFDSKQETEE